MFSLLEPYLSLPQQCDLIIETSQVVIHAHPFSLSMLLIVTCAASYILNECARQRLQRIPKGYRVHAGEELESFAPDKVQATTARYDISDHNFTSDISLPY
jgi:hypothetical protein